MYPLYEFDEWATRTTKLLSAYAPDGLVDHASLIRAYEAFLADRCPHLPMAVAHGGRTRIVDDPRVVRALVALFNEESSLDDCDGPPIKLSDPDSNRRSILQSLLTDSLENFGRVDQRLKYVVEASVRVVFWSDGNGVSHGGTSTNAVGTIWAGFSDAWGKRDFEEFLLHESIHTMIFVDEYISKQFHSLEPLRNKATFIDSSIRRQRRPLDKVFHSTVIASVIVWYRHLRGAGHAATMPHGSTAELIEGVLESVSQLKANTQAYRCLTDWGMHIMERCAALAVSYSDQPANLVA